MGDSTEHEGDGQMALKGIETFKNLESTEVFAR